MTTTSTAGSGLRIGNRSIGEFLMAQRAFIALFVLIIIFASLSDSFMTGTNLVTMTKHVAYNALLSLGMRAGQSSPGGSICPSVRSWDCRASSPA